LDEIEEDIDTSEELMNTKENTDMDNNHKNETINSYLSIPPSILRSRSQHRDKTKQVTFHPTTFQAKHPKVIARLSKCTNTLQEKLITNVYQMVYDSSAMDHMCPFPELFEDITYYNQQSANCPHVMMGDENTLLPIKGYGYIRI
jgi:hypothetical protein